MFDATLFRIAESETIATDPQQRILLEETYACLQSSNKLLAAQIDATCGKNKSFTCASDSPYQRRETDMQRRSLPQDCKIYVDEII